MRCQWWEWGYLVARRRDGRVYKLGGSLCLPGRFLGLSSWSLLWRGRSKVAGQIGQTSEWQRQRSRVGLFFVPVVLFGLVFDTTIARVLGRGLWE